MNQPQRQTGRKAELAPTLLGLFHAPHHPGHSCRLCDERADYVIAVLLGGEIFVGRLCGEHGRVTEHQLQKGLLFEGRLR